MFVINVMPRRTHVGEFEDHQGRYMVFKYDQELVIDDAEEMPIADRLTLYADTKEQADSVAYRMAMEHPGTDVYVCSPVSIFSSNKPEVFQKQVTNEGVLPF